MRQPAGTNYSTTSEEMLCKTCKFGQVVESSQGGTAVVCHYHEPATEQAVPQRLDMLVTKCNRYELPQLLRLWDTSIALRFEDGHCWLEEPRYIPALGHVHQRADTIGQRLTIFREHQGRVFDSQDNCFVGEAKPLGHAVANWWRRLQR